MCFLDLYNVSYFKLQLNCHPHEREKTKIGGNFLMPYIQLNAYLIAFHMRI